MDTAQTAVPPHGAAARGLSRPTVLETIRELAGVAGPAGALDLWARAAADAGAYGMDPEVGAHLRAATWLAEHAEARPAAPSPTASPHG